MKHLLLIANISIENRNLLEYSAAFCKHYNCKLHVLHISNYSEPIFISSPYYYDQNKISYSDYFEEKDVKNIASKVESLIDKDLVQVAIKKGNQENILNTFLNDNFIDFIIIGNQDIEAENDFINHKNLLLNVVDTPLLVVPNLQIFSPFKNLNFLTNRSEKDILDIIQLSKFFPASKIKVSHQDINGKESAIRDKKWEQYVSSKVPERIEYNHIQENVGDYVKRENSSLSKDFDAFVFTAKKRNFWSRLIDPSTTLRYLAGLEMPCIIFKNSEEK